MHKYEIFQKVNDQWTEVITVQARSASDSPAFLALYDEQLDLLDSKAIQGMRVVRDGRIIEEDVR